MHSLQTHLLQLHRSYYTKPSTQPPPSSPRSPPPPPARPYDPLRVSSKPSRPPPPPSVDASPTPTPPPPQPTLLRRLLPFFPTSKSKSSPAQPDPPDLARGIAASQQVVLTGVLDPRYRLAARRVTAIICALPIVIVVPYWLWQRRFGGVEKKVHPVRKSLEGDAAVDDGAGAAESEGG